VSEVSPHIQAKLLRVLQERAFERVGSSLTIGVDVRVVATSNRDLPRRSTGASSGATCSTGSTCCRSICRRCASGREMSEPLAEHFVGRVLCARGPGGAGWSDGALDLMAAYAWPGNVRELQNICERAVVLGRRAGAAWIDGGWSSPGCAAAGRCRANGGGASRRTRSPASTGGRGEARSGSRPNGIGFAGIGPPMGCGTGRGDPPAREIERETIVQTLQHFDGHRQKTARALGIGVRTLGLKLKKWKEEELVPRAVSEDEFGRRGAFGPRVAWVLAMGMIDQLDTAGALPALDAAMRFAGRGTR
jgi:DNA-binding NtrC family response regulator